MNSLSRIPVWAWYLFSVAFCYWIWNPYYSLYHVLGTDADASIKTLLVILTMIIASLYIVEGHRTLNVFGIIMFISLFACLFWMASRAGIHQTGTIQWWGQWIVGLLLTIALQGGRIYRNLTGRVPVAATVDADNGDHHHH